MSENKIKESREAGKIVTAGVGENDSSCERWHVWGTRMDRGETGMKYYRITWDGYLQGEYESEDEAKEAFIRYIEDEELDGYGRGWKDLISVEEL